jgi:hypothetical protein
VGLAQATLRLRSEMIATGYHRAKLLPNP